MDLSNRHATHPLRIHRLTVRSFSEVRKEAERVAGKRVGFRHRGSDAVEFDATFDGLLQNKPEIGLKLICFSFSFHFFSFPSDFTLVLTLTFLFHFRLQSQRNYFTCVTYQRHVLRDAPSSLELDHELVEREKL